MSISQMGRTFLLRHVATLRKAKLFTNVVFRPSKVQCWGHLAEVEKSSSNLGFNCDSGLFNLQVSFPRPRHQHLCIHDEVTVTAHVRIAESSTMLTASARSAAGKVIACERLLGRLSRVALSTSHGSSYRTRRHKATSATEVTSPEESHNSSLYSSPPLDSPPALFIQKYGRVLDLHAAQAQPQGPCPITHQKLTAVVAAVQDTSTYEELLEQVRLGQDGTEVSKNQIGENLFVDGEIACRSSILDSRDLHLGEDESSQQLKWAETRLELAKLPSYYLLLSKARLTALVCTTAAGGYCLAPFEFDPVGFFLCMTGVGLISCSANAVNQFLEVPFDSQMNRTRNRVLVRGLLTPRHAFAFATAVGAAGTYVLVQYVGTLAATLGVFNLVLYTCVYTPLKRASIINTWVGSVVGAVPPLIGWAAAAGSLWDPGCLVLAGVLFTWQFPHFNSLSWNLRPDYSRAGYRMMCVTHPALCRSVALRHSLGCTAVCLMAPILDVTEPAFALESLPLNAVLAYLSWNFYTNADSASSRRLFRFTLLHLPLLITLMYVSKKKREKLLKST